MSKKLDEPGETRLRRIKPCIYVLFLLGNMIICITSEALSEAQPNPYYMSDIIRGPYQLWEFGP